MKLRAALVALLLMTVGASAQAAITVQRVLPAGTGSVNIGVGETLTVRMDIRNPGSLEIFGVGYSAHGYNEAIVDFVSGRAVRRYLQDADDVFLPNSAGTPSVTPCGATCQRVLAESAIGANGNRVAFAQSVDVNPHATNDPSTDPGLDNVVGTPQFEIVFTGVALGTTTINFDTGYQGDGVIIAGGENQPGVGFALTVVVPEPSAMAASGAALASVIAVVAVRRRL